MCLKLLSCLFVLALAAIVCEGQRQYNPYLRNPFYRNLYYKNRDLYNLRRYYDGFYKKYNPFIANAQARVVAQSREANYGTGSYVYNYETENGIHAEERGVPVDIGNQEQEEQVEGAYSYISPEGLRVGVKYVADANGFRPVITYDGVNSAFYASQPAAANVAHTKH
ncbi:endocuticle structural glycoprotein SgAbd-9 isoform X1 [Drosophila guanche]|uniref:Blast:Larval cuticle protein LCP-22 n=1 Tax=Drosophila guanche TaxID=7266 RepID=A0A3B0JL44_DROGU|nr:endocuticle structural glycoprotein SgAbd-9 isoform X1 [Drosophila guanche]SPP74199.1 blast:Larval cuticle protein LCP-22 [Drosophila guanche]